MVMHAAARTQHGGLRPAAGRASSKAPVGAGIHGKEPKPARAPGPPPCEHRLRVEPVPADVAVHLGMQFGHLLAGLEPAADL